VGEDLSLTCISSPLDPPKFILLNPFHYTATKSSFTLLEITTGQDKIYGHTAQSPIVIIGFFVKKMSLVFDLSAFKLYIGSPVVKFKPVV